MGVVELNIPEQWSRNLVVEFLEFMKKKKKENHREIIIFRPFCRSSIFL
jgi:hypothetical protein